MRGLGAIALLCAHAGAAASPIQESEAALAPAVGSLSKGEVARIVDEYLAAREAVGPRGLEGALQRFSFFGDMRLRQEETFNVDGREDRHRTRTRLRGGLTYEVSPALLFGARLITGSRTDPRSPHVTFGDGFDDLEVSLDRAFVEWRPASSDSLWFKAGKFAQPMHRNPVYGELLWDADIQPEGVAGGFQLHDILGLDALSFQGGHYALVERSIGSDTWASFAELSGSGRPTANSEVRLSTAFTGIWDPTPDGSLILLDDNRGNAVSDSNGDGNADRFTSNFGVLNTTLEVHFDYRDTPLVVGLEWIDNLRARGGGGSHGYAAGLAWGRASKAGDLRCYYQYASVQQDAVFSPITQDDFVFATGHQSHQVGVMHQLTDSVGLHLWGLVSRAEDGSSEDPDWRVRFDLNIKF